MDFSAASMNTVLIVSGSVVAGLLVTMMFIKKFLYICGPHEILIFSGRSNTMADGSTVGFRVIQGGRVWRTPILEKVDRMDMRLITVPMTVQGAYSDGGIPLAVHAVANIKISSDDKYINNAIERFLGRGREEIARVAKETLEGHVRGVIATMTPEEVNEDRLKFATMLLDEAEKDLQKLGLQLDTLKIQHVADSQNYLDSIGRVRIAEILKIAEVAESDAVRAAEKEEARARARGEVANSNAQAAVQKKQNELRRYKAELEALARSEEERSVQAAHAARAEAEKQLQELRGELETIRLKADVTIPAEAARTVRELGSAAAAAPIEADGRAQAEALALIAAAWKESGGKAMDMYVLQNLDEIFSQVAKAATSLRAREVNLIDSGDGSTMSAYLAAYPATVGALLEQVSNTIGVDIGAVLTGHGNGTPPQLGAGNSNPTNEVTSPEGGMR